MQFISSAACSNDMPLLRSVQLLATKCRAPQVAYKKLLFYGQGLKFLIFKRGSRVRGLDFSAFSSIICFQRLQLHRGLRNRFWRPGSQVSCVKGGTQG